MYLYVMLSALFVVQHKPTLRSIQIKKFLFKEHQSVNDKIMEEINILLKDEHDYILRHIMIKIQNNNIIFVI